MITDLKLRIVYDTRDQEVLKSLPKNGIYVEFDTDTFRQVLNEEYNKVKNIDRAFERTCDRLKKEILKI